MLTDFFTIDPADAIGLSQPTPEYEGALAPALKQSPLRR
jgi:hypothetical protein